MYTQISSLPKKTLNTRLYIYIFFSRQASSLFSLVSSWDAIMIGTKLKILKICLSGLAVFLVHFLHSNYAVFFVIKLIVFVLAYIMPNLALALKGQKLLFLSLVRLGEKFLEFYLFLIGLFFLYRNHKLIKFWWQSIFPAIAISNWNR